MNRSPATHGMHDAVTRRRWLRGCSAGLLGLSLPNYLASLAPAAERAANNGFGRAKACIVLYCWGGVSQLESWDPKPHAPVEVRGEFKPIATAVPGIHLSEHMPRLGRQMNRLAVVRSVHHSCTAHGKSMYWNRTGHEPPEPNSGNNLPPSLNDWPTLGAQVARQRRAKRGMPAAVQIPYHLIDNDTLQAGDTPGWLGNAYAPLLVHPNRGTPFAGVSRDQEGLRSRPVEDRDDQHLLARLDLSRRLEGAPAENSAMRDFERCQEQAADLLCNAQFQRTLDLDQESAKVRDSYGEHLCGQSLLLARRMVESGVPLVTVICSAGDLNGGSGDNWDTHSNNFSKLKNSLLPTLDRASSALLDDLDSRGLLDTTLVAWLTEFGRTPRIMGSGRNHYPFCYSVALAGGGIRGGQVYGRSDSQAAHPLDLPCGPNDVHATILHALGIPLNSTLLDVQGRPQSISDGQPLPLFS